MSTLAAISPEPTAEPIRNGVFVAVVGPSGAGKDSVIGHAQSAFRGDSRIVFVRRVITRPSNPGAEDHDTLEEAEFVEAERSGAFAMSWGAHGLRYGIPASVDAHILDGCVAVANLSRNAIPQLCARYANVVVAEISAAPEILADRLAKRGRESRGEVLARLARAAALDVSIPGLVRIDNSGELAEAGASFVMTLREALGSTKA